MNDLKMTIDGVAVGANPTLEVLNPATCKTLGYAPDCTPEELDLAFASAHRAFGAWRTDEQLRRQALNSCADVLVRERDYVARILTAEQGKPFQDAQREISTAAAWLRYFANLELDREVIQDDDQRHVEVIHKPLGVIAAITPWNFPIALSMWKVGPALRAGNTMVLKPSPYTPLSTLAVGQLLSEALPPGVLNVVSGVDSLGPQLTAHPIPRKISFTGSTATGKRVAEAAAHDLKRVTLELGGNDPAIILEDADPAAIADTLFWNAFSNNGQICLAVKRVYVPDSLHDDIVDALSAIAATVTVGDGMTEGVRLGAINNEPQYNRIGELVADAVQSGATIAAGGSRIDRPGYFFEPTIISDVSDGTRIVDEEQFGPVLPIIRYRDVDDAVRRANAGMYGLTASVWSSDSERAATLGRQIDCGQVSVNVHGGAVLPHLPFSGHKWSGLGVENGIWGLRTFTETQVVSTPATVRG